MNAALRLGGRHPLHAVAARLETQTAVDLIARDAQHHFLVAAKLAGRLAEQLGAPSLALGIAGVHAQQVAGKQRRFVAAGAGANFQISGTRIVRVLGQQQALQLLRQLRAFGLCRLRFVLGHLLHVGIGLGIVQQGLGFGQVGFALLQAGPAAGDDRYLGMLARQRHELFHVAQDVLARQQKIELGQALCVALQLSAHEGFHGEGAAS